MGFMILIPNNDRGHPIDGASEKGQEYQVVRIFGKDRCFLGLKLSTQTNIIMTIHSHRKISFTPLLAKLAVCDSVFVTAANVPAASKRSRFN
jgi:hypothetical protein